MKTNEITFEQAYSYILYLCKLFNKTDIADRIGISRNIFAAVINGTSDKYGKPTTLPAKWKQPIIDFVKSIQFDVIIEVMPIVEPPVTKFKKEGKSSVRNKREVELI